MSTERPIVIEPAHRDRPSSSSSSSSSSEMRSSTGSSSGEGRAADRETQRSMEHGKAAGDHAYKAGSAAAKMGAHRVEEAKDMLGENLDILKHKLATSAQEMGQEAQHHLHTMRSEAKHSFSDLYHFFWKHPLLTSFALALAFVLGLMLTSSSLFRLPFISSSEPWYYYSSSSPQYKAHHALETILQSYYGPPHSMLGLSSSSYPSSSSYSPSMMQKAWHSLSDVMHSTKRGIFDNYDDGSTFGGAASRLGAMMPSSSSKGRWIPSMSSSSTPGRYSATNRGLTSYLSPTSWYNWLMGTTYYNYDNDEDYASSAMQSLRGLGSGMGMGSGSGSMFGRGGRSSSMHDDHDEEMTDLKRRLKSAIKETHDL